MSVDTDNKAQARGGVLGALARQDDAFIRRVLIHQMLYGGSFAKVERLPEHLAARPASEATIEALTQRLADQGLGVEERTLRGDVARVRRRYKEAEARRARDGRAEPDHWLIEVGRAKTTKEKVTSSLHGQRPPR
jgi:hypothetical protein